MEDPRRPSFADLLRELRLKRGCSQRSLARLAALDSTYLSRLERNVVHPPKVPTVHRLAEALQLSPPDEIALIEASGRLPESMTVVPRAQLEASTEPKRELSRSTPLHSVFRPSAHEPVTEEMHRAQGLQYDELLAWLKATVDQSVIPQRHSSTIDVHSRGHWASIGVHPWHAQETKVTAVITLVTGIRMRPALATYLLNANTYIQFGALGVDANGNIRLQDAIPGSTCGMGSLQGWLDTLIDTAEQYADPISTRWGGRRLSFRE